MQEHDWAVERKLERAEDEFSPLPVLDASIAQELNTHPEVHRFRISLRLGAMFACPPQDYSPALDNIKRSLMLSMYGDIKRLLHEVRDAAYAGDRRRIFEVCEKIDACMSIKVGKEPRR